MTVCLLVERLISDRKTHLPTSPSNKPRAMRKSIIIIQLEGEGSPSPPPSGPPPSPRAKPTQYPKSEESIPLQDGLSSSSIAKPYSAIDKILQIHHSWLGGIGSPSPPPVPPPSPGAKLNEHRIAIEPVMLGSQTTSSFLTRLSLSPGSKAHRCSSGCVPLNTDGAGSHSSPPSNLFLPPTVKHGRYEDGDGGPDTPPLSPPREYFRMLLVHG
jgi:hypothetical protein